MTAGFHRNLIINSKGFLHGLFNGSGTYRKAEFAILIITADLV